MIKCVLLRAQAKQIFQTGFKKALQRTQFRSPGSLLFVYYNNLSTSPFEPSAIHYVTLIYVIYAPCDSSNLI